MFLVILIVVLIFVVYQIYKGANGDKPNHGNTVYRGDSYNMNSYQNNSSNVNPSAVNPSAANPSFTQKMEQSVGQFNNYARTGQTNTAPQIKNNGSSMKSENGVGCSCMKCNQPLSVTYGNIGGFCTNCNGWSFDRNVAVAQKENVMESMSEANLLVKYPRVHARISGKEYFPTMSVMPNGIFLQDAGGWSLAIPFSSLKASTASKGMAQQLTLIMEENQNPVSINIDMQGGSYDDLSGEDLHRIHRLITEG